MRAYLPRFEMRAPGRLAAVLELMAAEPGTWRPFAGGTDVMVELAAGKLDAGKYVSIWELDDLRGIEVTPDAVTLGALTTYTEVRRHALMTEEFPMLGEAAALSGAIAIQNRGTIGGNIINASPAADSPPALLAYDARLELVSASGSRWVPYDGFHTAYKQMDRRPDELLRAIQMPRRPGGSAALHYYRKVGTRKAQAIAKVGLAAVGNASEGRITHLRLGLSSVAPTVVSAPATRAVLEGGALDDASIEAGAKSLSTELAPISDVRSTEPYRRQVAVNLLRDFLHELRDARS